MLLLFAALLLLPLVQSHQLLKNGRHFEDIRRMTRVEHQKHQEALQSFLNHPSLFSADHINGKIHSHTAEQTDSYGRHFFVNYTVEHSDVHYFHFIDPSGVVDVQESIDGRELSVTYATAAEAAVHYRKYRRAMTEELKIMVSGSAKWNIKRSFNGLQPKVGHFFLPCLILSCHFSFLIFYL
jgi:hypothetical protein